MTKLKDDVDAEIKKIFHSKWIERDGQKVPESGDIQLGNHAVKLDGTVLYADLADSTKMVEGYKNWFAAEVYKAFLYSSAKIIRDMGGTITAYDGDRVMAVFIGDSKNSDAAKCALKINYAVTKIIKPAIKARYTTNTYVMKHVVGVDSSPLYDARTGIRGSNDLVWVGRAANYAAKFAALDNTHTTYISKSVYDMLNEGSKFGGDPKRNMWSNLGKKASGLNVDVYGSTFWWGI